MKDERHVTKYYLHRSIGEEKIMRAYVLASFALLTLAGLPGGAWAQRGGLQPGQWEMTTTVNMASIPGIKTVRNRSRTVRHCVTPQSAMDGGRDLLIARGCTAKRFSFANGKINALTSCGPVGQAMLTETTGTYTATTLQTMSHSNAQGPVSMKVEIQGQGRWIGVCAAGSKP